MILILMIVMTLMGIEYWKLKKKMNRKMLGGEWGWECWQGCWHWHWHSSCWESKGTEEKALLGAHLQEWPKFLLLLLANGACETRLVMTTFATQRRSMMSLITFMFNPDTTLCSILIIVGGCHYIHSTCLN